MSKSSKPGKRGRLSEKDKNVNDPVIEEILSNVKKIHTSGSNSDILELQKILTENINNTSNLVNSKGIKDSVPADNVIQLLNISAAITNDNNPLIVKTKTSRTKRRVNETLEQREQRLAQERARMALYRRNRTINETPEQREARLAAERIRMANYRKMQSTSESVEVREQRLAQERVRMAAYRNINKVKGSEDSTFVTDE